MENYSDQELIANYLKGDEEALEILIQRYLKPIYSFAYHYAGNVQEAEDITQEVFVKVWKNLKKFDQEKNFKTWIFTIAKNTSLDFLKKRKAMPSSEFSGWDTLIDPSALPDKVLAKEEIGEMLGRAINQLSPKSRAVLSLSYDKHLTFREISESLNEPLNTVKSRHRRALIMLKKILSES